MNVVSRGIKNALRSPLRSGAIVLMLAVSIGLILSMLVARSGIDAQIKKDQAGTGITIRPAGIMDFSGGGTPLTSTQLATITKTDHIASTSATLSDQLGTTDTNLTSAIDFGSFGLRQQRFDSSSSTATSTSMTTPNTSPADSSTTRSARTPHITVSGTTDPNSISTDGSKLNITKGATIDGNSSDLIALVGSDLATKNSLSVGSTFTAYGSTITVKGIYNTGNKAQDSGIIMPLTTVQSLTSQTGSITSVNATVDSSSNVNSVVSALKTSLGSTADITSQAEQAATSVASLKSIASLALAGVIGATIAGAVIVLLAMIMVVRERRREIGVIKAIGGSSRKVIGQFVAEALTLTVIGSIIGLALGVAISGPMTTSLVSSSTSSSVTSTNGRPFGGPGGMFQGGFNQVNKNLTAVQSTLTPTIFVSAVGITLLIAIVGAAVPAWFISKIRPAEVLRTE